jgi:FkbM family methyltransferase
MDPADLRYQVPAMTFVSYAQNFEDVMLHRALAHVKHGFFVDVGAQHPSDDSVTKAFSLRGWRGINIEPVPHWYNLLVEDRLYDINLNIAVGAGDGLTIFEVEDTGWSTADRALADQYRAEGKLVHEHRVPATTLDVILEEQRIDVVHFLKVDCEGAERVALESCSFDRVRPWIVVVEATEPNSQIASHDKWESILLGHDYRFAYFDGLNRFYVASEHAELLPAFAAPPNVFDNFIRARHKLAHDERHHLRREAVALRADLVETRSVIGHLSDSLDATHRDHAEQLAAAREVARDAEALRGRLEQEVLRRDRIIGALVTSGSWRLTAPLRGAKLLARSVLRRGWRFVRPLAARGARLARPVVHMALRVPGVRSIARKILGPQTRLGSRIRRFLVPGSMGHVSTVVGPVVLNERAQAMEALLRAAMTRQKRDQG